MMAAALGSGGARDARGVRDADGGARVAIALPDADADAAERVAGALSEGDGDTRRVIDARSDADSVALGAKLALGVPLGDGCAEAQSAAAARSA